MTFVVDAILAGALFFLCALVFCAIMIGGRSE